MAAVQCVYEGLIADAPIAPAKQIEDLKTRIKNNKEEQKLTLGEAIEPNYSLLKDIIEGVAKFCEEIDQRITPNLSADWKRERMSKLLIAILQCATFELFFYKEGKEKIIIDEYTRLTDRFFDQAEVNFVHGILKKLAG